jgi:hypothetical protein
MFGNIRIKVGFDPRRFGKIGRRFWRFFGTGRLRRIWLIVRMLVRIVLY